AGKMVVNGDAAILYTYQGQQRYQQQLRFHETPLLFVHPPQEVLVFALLAYLPYAAAFFLWIFLNFVALVAAILVLARMLPRLQSELPVLLLFVGCSPAALFAMRQGQDSALLLLLFTLCYLALTRGEEPFAGVLLALPPFKPQFLLLPLLAFAIERRWRLLRAFLETAAVLAAISIAVLGRRCVLSFPRFMVEFGRMP